MDRRTHILTLVTLAVSASSRRALADPPELVVIVNPKNPTKSLDEDELYSIFTTRKRDWDHGGRIIPFNFPAKNEYRVAFDEAVLHMDADEVARYWIDRRVRGGDPPPKKVPNAKVMRGVVAKLKRSIGYLPVDEVDDSVRVVARVKNGDVEKP